MARRRCGWAGGTGKGREGLEGPEGYYGTGRRSGTRPFQTVARRTHYLLATFGTVAASPARSNAPTPTLARVIRLIASRTFLFEWRREPCRSMHYSPAVPKQ